MKSLAVLGASGHGKVVADAALAGAWGEIRFYDDAWPTLKHIGPWSVVGATKELLQDCGSLDGAIVAIGDNKTRLAKMRQIGLGVPLVSIIHPAAVVSRYASIGKGSVVFAGAVVNAFASLGMGCIVNTGATIDHDCNLGDGVHVGPGANLGGQVVVGAATWIGIGASVRHGVSLGDHVVVGAGAAVVGDIVAGQIVVGVPARQQR
ncbi:MAG: acetyltransferase [Burkholderiales bacterium]|nr:acetyltransferase [Burkholderiales bacterium]